MSTAPSLALALEDTSALVGAADVQFDDEWALSRRSAPVAALSLAGDSSGSPLAVAVVPEPATLLLLGTALGWPRATSAGPDARSRLARFDGP